MSEPAPRPKRWRRLASVVLRVTLAALTVLLGLYTVRTYLALLRGPAPTVTAAPEQPTPVERLGPPFLGEGTWQLGDEQSGMRMGLCATAQLIARLDRPPAANAPDGALEGWLRSLLHQPSARRARWAEGSKYVIDLGSVRARIFTRDRNRQERRVVARLAYRVDSRTWNVLELGPKAATAPDRNSHDLLPLPPGTQILARRIGSGGQLTAELAQVSTSLRGLRSFWEAQGYPARGESLEEGLICPGKHGGVRVWGPAPGADEVGLVFLIRSAP